MFVFKCLEKIYQKQKKRLIRLQGAFQLPTKVARWFSFKPKIPIWVYFGGPWYGKCWYFYDHLEYFTAIW
jgi:hypothetical protein